jgi:hypothetical protein
MVLGTWKLGIALLDCSSVNYSGGKAFYPFVIEGTS